MKNLWMLLGLALVVVLATPKQLKAEDCICGSSGTCMMPGGFPGTCINTDDYGHSVCDNTCTVPSAALQRQEQEMNQDMNNAQIQNCEDARDDLDKKVRQVRHALVACRSDTENLQQTLNTTREQSTNELNQTREEARANLNACAKSKREALADSLGLCMQTGNKIKEKINAQCASLSFIIGDAKRARSRLGMDNNPNKEAWSNLIASLEQSKRDLGCPSPKLTEEQQKNLQKMLSSPIDTGKVIKSVK